MPARASAANQAPLRDRPAVAESSRSAAIAPHPGSWPGLSLQLRGSSPSSGSGASAGHLECHAQDLLAHALSDRYLVPTELTEHAYRVGCVAGPAPLASGRLPDWPAGGARVAVGGRQSSTSSRAGPG